MDRRIFFSCIESSTMRILISVLFTMIVMIIAILTVCLTAPKSSRFIYLFSIH
jgi:hypothetical protein